jgi:hypothetical protein
MRLEPLLTPFDPFIRLLSESRRKRRASREVLGVLVAHVLKDEASGSRNPEDVLICIWNEGQRVSALRQLLEQWPANPHPSSFGSEAEDLTYDQARLIRRFRKGKRPDTVSGKQPGPAGIVPKGWLAVVSVIALLGNYSDCMTATPRRPRCKSYYSPSFRK